MNCQEALNLLYDVIDKEASQIDANEVQKHLDQCQDCLKKFQIEESLQALVKEKLKAALDIPKIDHLKAKVLFQLGQMDASFSQSRLQYVPFRFPAVALAAAASIIVFIGAAFWGKGLYDHYRQYIPIERAHWSAANDTNEFSDQNNTQLALAGVGSDFGVGLLNILGNLSMVGGKSQKIDGIDVPHFVYQNGDKIVSAFVFPADKFTIPDDLAETRVDIDGQCRLSHNCRGCWLVFFKAGNAIIVTATTDREFDLLAFNPISGAI